MNFGNERGGGGVGHKISETTAPLWLSCGRNVPCPNTYSSMHVVGLTRYCCSASGFSPLFNRHCLFCVVSQIWLCTLKRGSMVVLLGSRLVVSLPFLLTRLRCAPRVKSYVSSLCCALFACSYRINMRAPSSKVSARSCPTLSIGRGGLFVHRSTAPKVLFRAPAAAVIVSVWWVQDIKVIWQILGDLYLFALFVFVASS